jgi:hypothetical protein
MAGPVRRSRNWRIGLAEDLRDPALAQAFAHACRDEGIPPSLMVRVKADTAPAIVAPKVSRRSDRRARGRRRRRALR